MPDASADSTSFIAGSSDPGSLLKSSPLPTNHADAPRPRHAPSASTTTSEVIFRSSKIANAFAASSPAAIVRGFAFIASPAVRLSAAPPSRSNNLRKSPSLITPRKWPDFLHRRHAQLLR